jgi:predicted nicotinamide N-methyase
MYPSTEKTFLSGADACTLLIPLEDAVKLEYENEVAKETVRIFPYWTRVWDAAWVMAAALIEHKDLLQNKTCLELGAGMALPSFIASRYAKKVIATDYTEDAVQWMQQNAVFSQTHLHTLVLDWQKDEFWPDHDILIISDVLYEPTHHARLHQIITKAWDEKKTIFLTSPERPSSLLFLEKLAIPAYKKKTIQTNYQGYPATIILYLFYQAIP